MVMPGMNGKELSEKVKGYLPKIKVLFMSGYPKGEAAFQNNFLDPETVLIQKPFKPLELIQRVQLVLN
jgi:CheY-like chemotaxis protein